MHACQSVGWRTWRVGEKAYFALIKGGVVEACCHGSLTDRSASAAPCSHGLTPIFNSFICLFVWIFYFLFFFGVSSSINIKAWVQKPVFFSFGAAVKVTVPNLAADALIVLGVNQPVGEPGQASAWQRRTAVPLRPDLFFKYVYD